MMTERQASGMDITASLILPTFYEPCQYLGELGGGEEDKVALSLLVRAALRQRRR
jgi:hypothetical protein